MILERIYEVARPRLAGKRIKEIRIGLHMLAVELDSGLIGVTYVLINELGHNCTASQAGNLVGMPADEIASWALRAQSVIDSAVGLAVLNSAADYENLEYENNPQGPDAAYSVAIRDTDQIGVVGYIEPLINSLRNKGYRLFVFERDESFRDRAYMESAQPELLPKCQVVFITSSTLINRTLENILSHCSNAREIIMVGPSTPLYPEAFKGTGVTVLAGTRWLPKNRDDIMAGVSQGAGMKQLVKFGEKISVRVR